LGKLEDQTKVELDLPTREGSAHLAEAGDRAVGVCVAKVRVIEQIESFRAKL
jgi:hypothetical protein